MDFCPKCGAMVLNGSCNLCGFNLNGFNLSELKIRIPEEYISDKSNYKNNYNKLLDLISNKNQVNFTKEDILKNYSEIIDIANKNFIDKEKKIILSEFNSELKSCVNFIDYKQIEYFKDKFNKDYFSYYDKLHFYNKIKKFNRIFTEKRKEEVLIEFKNDLNSYDTILTEEDINRFKSKYNESCCNFFITLKMKNEIEKFNKKQIEEAFKILRNEYSLSDSVISKEMLLELKSKYPSIEWDNIIKNYNRQFYKKKFESHKTTDGVYYLHDYIRKDDWNFSNQSKVRISKEILKYKNGEKRAVTRFTNELIDFIEKFIEYELNIHVKEIFLVSIPSSTNERDVNSSIKKTIRIIVDNYEKDLINLNSNQKIINLSDLLYRKIDVTASHIQRQSYEVHMKTIELDKSKLTNFDEGLFIILDDITTTGNIMDACTDILIKNGINREKIYKIAIAATG